MFDLRNLGWGETLFKQCSKALHSSAVTIIDAVLGLYIHFRRLFYDFAWFCLHYSKYDWYVGYLEQSNRTMMLIICLYNAHLQCYYISSICLFTILHKCAYKFWINRIMALSAFNACFVFRTLLPLLSPFLCVVPALISPRHVFQICCMLQRNVQQHTAAGNCGKQNEKIQRFVWVC